MACVWHRLYNNLLEAEAQLPYCCPAWASVGRCPRHHGYGIPGVFMSDSANLWCMFQNFLDAIPEAVKMLGTVIGILAGCIAIRQYRKGKREAAAKNSPAFKDRPHASPTKGPGILHYTSGAFRFRGRVEELKALHAFADSDGLFSWWLAYGPGGTGKSRLALEFCQQMEKEKWQAEFLDLANTPRKVWDKWQPEKPTLLVIDYVSEEFSKDKDAASRGVKTNEDILYMFERLMHRIASKPTITKKIRVLLLEREYKTRSSMNKGENVDWYAQLTDSSTHPSAVTIGKYEYDTPLVIPRLEDKAIHKLALEAWKSEDPSRRSLPKNFRKQLRRIDDQERTLFAIMLALYRAKHPDAEGLTADTLLEYILKLEWRKRLELAGYCSDNLHLLLLATIMRTYVLSREENEKTKLNEEKLCNFGLGQYVHQGGGNIELKGLEPDILGEYLILRGYVKRNVVPHVKVEDLVAQAWEANPSETASFFARCMQNFHDEPPLSAYLRNPPESVGAQAAWAWTVLGCIAYHIDSYNFIEAKHLHSVLISVGSHDDFQEEKETATKFLNFGHRNLGKYYISLHAWIAATPTKVDKFRKKALAELRKKPISPS
jgi:DNA polymerase III delta prime subunit